MVNYLSNTLYIKLIFTFIFPGYGFDHQSQALRSSDWQYAIIVVAKLKENNKLPSCHVTGVSDLMAQPKVMFAFVCIEFSLTGWGLWWPWCWYSLLAAMSWLLTSLPTSLPAWSQTCKHIFTLVASTSYTLQFLPVSSYKYCIKTLPSGFYIVLWADI